MVAILKILKTKCATLSDDLFLCQVSKGYTVRFPRNVSDKIDAEEKGGIIIIIIIITRNDMI
jgi:hypothetical protein